MVWFGFCGQALVRSGMIGCGGVGYGKGFVVVLGVTRFGLARYGKVWVSW